MPLGFFVCFFKYLFYVYGCLGITYIQCLREPEEGIRFPGLELQMVVPDHECWKSNPGSSRRVASAGNC